MLEKFSETDIGDLQELIRQVFFSVIFLLLFFVVVFRAAPWHMEVSRLGVKLDLQLLVYTTATATWDLRLICHLYHSSQQHQILNPLSGPRDQT